MSERRGVRSIVEPVKSGSCRFSALAVSSHQSASRSRHRNIYNHYLLVRIHYAYGIAQGLSCIFTRSVDVAFSGSSLRQLQHETIVLYPPVVKYLIEAVDSRISYRLLLLQEAIVRELAAAGELLRQNPASLGCDTQKAKAVV